MKFPKPKPTSFRQAISKPTTKVLASTGGSGASTGTVPRRTSLSSQVPMAAIRVAAVPKTQSTRPRGLARLDKKQPTARPGMAAGVKTGRTVRASENRNCTGP